MQPKFSPIRLDVMAMARSAVTLSGDVSPETEPGTTRVSFGRLGSEACLASGLSRLSWQAQAQLRTGPAGGEQAWIHLTAQAVLPMVCQRCLLPADVSITADRWFRFVSDEETAMAEDDLCDEDLLVLQPQFNLLELVEDELIMSLPLVPMHAQCPVDVRTSVGEDERGDPAQERPHPFAGLSALKSGRRPD